MIVFEKIVFRNILSFGDNPTEVILNSSNLTSIRGLNSAGKSTFLEAICFGLFGKTFRKMNKPNLVNNRNNRGLLVEVFFKSNDNEFIIKRGINPAIFEIIKNGTLINQGSATRDYQEFLEQNILQIDYNTFIQIVVLGTASRTSFMKLTPEQRRKFIENIFGLNVFARMGEIHKLNINNLKARINEFKTNFTIQKERIGMQEKMIQSLKDSDEQHQKEKQDRMDERIKQYEDMIEKNAIRVEDLENKIMTTQYDDIQIKKKLRSIKDLIGKARFKSSEYQKNSEFFRNNLSCPTCEQSIDEEFRTQKLNKISDELLSIQNVEESLIEKQAEFDDIIKETDRINDMNKQIMAEIMSIQAESSMGYKFINSFKKDINKESDESSAKIQEEIQNLENMMKVQEDMLLEREDLLNMMERYEIITAILGDGGVKKTIIKQYLPTVNSQMNAYLRDLGFNVKFSIDEDFNEKIIIRGMETTYSCLSEGERQKIDLCSVLAWQGVSQIRARFSTNLFVADEILDGNLDSGSIEAFMNILKNLPDKNIFIITHNPSYSSFFDSQIEVEKKSNGFSSLKRI